MENLFSYGNPPWVQVTQGRVIIREDTYALSNISSVTRTTQPVTNAGEVMLGSILMAGVLAPIAVIVMVVSGYDFENPIGAVAAVIMGLASCAIGFMVSNSGKNRPPIHIVHLQTNAGRVQALQTLDADLADGLVAAISRVLDGSQQATTAPVVSPVVAVGGGFCSACGKPVAPGAKFCAGCGAAVAAT